MSVSIRVYFLDSEGYPLALEPGDSPAVFVFENKYRWIKEVQEFLSEHVGRVGHRFDFDSGEAMSGEIVDLEVFEGSADHSDYFRGLCL